MPTGALEPAPARILDEWDRPRFGTYAGLPEAIDYLPMLRRRGRGRLFQVSHHKKWIYLSFWNEDLLAAVALLDAGYAGKAFAFVFHRGERRFLVDRTLALPPGLIQIGDRPGEGASARLWLPGGRITISRAARASSYRVHLDLGPRFRLRATVDSMGAPPPITAICEVKNGQADELCNTTVKWPHLATGGEVEADGRRLSLDGCVAGIDFTSGLMARNTSWRWVFCAGRARGRRIALNLASGFNGARENVLWLDGVPLPLGQAAIEMSSSEPMRPWRITTDCGRVDLRFAPQGVRQDSTHLAIVVSRYIQPIGAFAGTLHDAGGNPLFVEAGDLTGVTEDHLARW